MNWIEVIGYAGTVSTVLTYSMKHMLSLRIMALISTTCFLGYAAYIQSIPLMLTEAILAPINLYRLLELLRPRRDTSVPSHVLP